MSKPFRRLAVVLAAASAYAEAPQIDHRGIACAVAEKFPRIEARLTAPEAIAKARVVFQGDNVKEWYSVTMQAEGASHFGVLPKPKKSLKAFRYYIEVTGKALETSRTPEFVASVVSSASECKGQVMAGTVASATVAVQGPTGAAVLPSGFAPAGIVTGAVAGAAAGAAVAGGGGLSGGALVGIIAGVGGAAAAGVTVAGKGDNGGSGSGGPGPSPTPAPTSYTGPFSGQRLTEHIFPGGCQTWTQTIMGTLTITLQPNQGAAVTGTAATTGNMTIIATSGGGSGDCGAPIGSTTGIGWTSIPVTGSPGAMVFGAQSGSGGITEAIDFTGALSSGVITGTLSFTQRSDLGRFGQAAFAMTLR